MPDYYEERLDALELAFFCRSISVYIRRERELGGQPSWVPNDYFTEIKTAYHYVDSLIQIAENGLMRSPPEGYDFSLELTYHPAYSIFTESLGARNRRSALKLLKDTREGLLLLVQKPVSQVPKEIVDKIQGRFSDAARKALAVHELLSMG